jgi:hypothetical protein
MMMAGAAQTSLCLYHGRMVGHHTTTKQMARWGVNSNATAHTPSLLIQPNTPVPAAASSLPPPLQPSSSGQQQQRRQTLRQRQRRRLRVLLLVLPLALLLALVLLAPCRALRSCQHHQPDSSSISSMVVIVKGASRKSKVCWPLAHAQN